MLRSAGRGPVSRFFGHPGAARSPDKRSGKRTFRFRRAEAALAAAAHEPDEDRYDALNGAFHNALRRLLRTPAPDLNALAVKIHLSVDHEIATLTGAEPCLAALRRDARRLAR